jgi:CO dehydrogenase/acetyl-CoA synthase delta subunit
MDNETLTLEDIKRLFKEMQIEELNDVTIEGDLEIEVEPSASGVTPEILRSVVVANESRQLLQHLANLLQV